MVSKKKFFLATFVSLLLLSVGLFHKPLICIGLKTFVKKIPLFEEGKISYQGLGCTTQGIYLEGIHIALPSTENQFITIERLECDWSFRGFLKLEGSYKIVKPSLSINPDLWTTWNSFSLYEIMSSPILSKKLTLEEGELALIGSKHSARVSFSFTPGKEGNHLGTIQMGLDQTSHVEMCLYKNYKEILMDMQVDTLSLQQMQDFGLALNQLKENWRVEEGVLSGKLQIGVTADNRLHRFLADLAIHECKAERVDHSGIASLKWGGIQSYLPEKKQDLIQLEKFSISEVLHTLVSKLQWDQGYISRVHPHTQTVWALQEVVGSVTFEQAQSPELVFQGLFGKDEEFYPLTIQGQGLTMSENSWWMELGVEILTRQETPTHLSIYMALLESQEMCIKTSLEQMGVTELQMVQDWVQLIFPKVQDIELLEGFISTDITVHLFNQSIQSVALDKLQCLGIKAKSLKGPWKAQCEHAQGKLKWYFPSIGGCKAPSWEFSFKNLDVQKEDDADFFITNEGYLSSQEWHINPSWITASMQGVKAHCQLRGPYASMEVSTTVVLDESHPFSHFQEEMLQMVPHLERLGKIDLSCKILQEKGVFNILGATHFYYDHKPVDTLRFGAEIKFGGGFFSRANKEWKGWFQSEALSENTYLAFLKYYNQKWYALGSMRVTGEWDQESVRFGLESAEAVYESEDIKITMPKQEELYTGDFIFDIENKSWDITLPIRGASCIDKKLHLPFEDVRADVTIQGMQLKAENISASCEQVLFTGRLDLDFADPQWIELKLYPTTFYGDAQDFIRFLQYLPEFKNFESPCKGKVEGVGHSAIVIRYNALESEKQTKIGLKIEGGEYAINDFSTLKGIHCLVAWDSSQGFLEVKDLEGDLYLHRNQEDRMYHLNAQNFVSKNVLQGEWDFDLRIEAPTFDILRVVGSTKHTERGIRVDLQEKHTHFFGTKVEIQDLVFLPEGHLEALSLKSKFFVRDLLSQIQLCALCGLIDMDASLIQEIKTLKTEGEVWLDILYDKEQKQLQVNLESDSLGFNQVSLKSFSSKLTLQQDKIELCYLKTEKLYAEALMKKEALGWEIPNAQIQWNQSFLKFNQGKYENHCLNFDKLQMKFILEELSSALNLEPFWEKIACGHLDLEGKMHLDCMQGWQSACVEADLHFGVSSISEAELTLTSEDSFHIVYHPQKGIGVHNLSVALHHKEVSDTWTVLDLKQLQILPIDKTLRGQGCRLILPPEMLLYLAKEEFLPYLQYQEGQLLVSHKECKWDNQIDTEFDFTYEHQAFQIQGLLKDGYYWIGERSFYLQKFHYVLDHDQLSVLFGWDYEDVALDVLAKIHLQEEMEAKILLKEGHQEDRDERTSLEIACRYGSEDGFDIQSIEGQLYGLEFAFRRNPRTYVPDVIILTGQMKIDTSGLVKSFPKLFYQTMKDLGMGSGYELSGDWAFSKKEFKSSHFKGFLKGRDFEFLGYYFKTLLSEVDIDSHSIVIHDFSLSDVSGVVQIKEVKIEHSEDEKSWKMKIPEIMVQEFRPSFLKKYDTQVERAKPFVIKDLHFFNIEGTLGSKESFSGRGYLDFINTFKRAYNLLDIPIEIIGRIGFDLGLFVPVIGKIEFDMHEGKIFLKELKHAYSEGKRSKFYLSGYKDSYIGLDGSLFIDIKMKQYVLLKITQPFTLSIRGSLVKPQYSLR